MPTNVATIGPGESANPVFSTLYPHNSWRYSVVVRNPDRKATPKKITTITAGQ